MGLKGKRIAFGALGLALLLAAPRASAQEPAEEPAPSAPPAPARDLVRLKNGGLIRGTISELVPGESLVIVTITGETKRISMTEVEYAGPDAPQAQPAPPRPPAPAPAPWAPMPVWGPVTVRLETRDEPLTFYAAPAEGGRFTQLCTAPCDVTVPPGNHRFALAEPRANDPKPALPVLRITAPTTVRGIYRRRGVVRGIGALILSVGGVIGGYLFLTATDEENVCTSSGCKDVEVTNDGKLWGGGTIFVGSVIAGVIMLTRSDSATVELVASAPSGFSAPNRFAMAEDRATMPATLPGLSFVGRF